MYFPQEDVQIPFQIEGIISYIPTRKPTKSELAAFEGNYLMLTPNLPTWDPHTTIYRNQEYSMTDYNGNIKPRGLKSDRPENKDIFVSSVEVLGDSISSINSVHRKGRVDAPTLAKRLNIPLEMAKKAIQATTQLSDRTVEEPSLTRKFSANDRMLRYTRLATNTFMDTFFSAKKSGPS